MVMTVLYFTLIDVVLTPNLVYRTKIEYDHVNKIVYVKATVSTSAPSHIYDIQIKQRGDRVVIKAYTNYARYGG